MEGGAGRFDNYRWSKMACDVIISLFFKNDLLVRKLKVERVFNGNTYRYACCCIHFRCCIYCTNQKRWYHKKKTWSVNRYSWCTPMNESILKHWIFVINETMGQRTSNTSGNFMNHYLLVRSSFSRRIGTGI